ncbi:unnamed protein product [Choristocarpus tenellus]
MFSQREQWRVDLWKGRQGTVSIALCFMLISTKYVSGLPGGWGGAGIGGWVGRADPGRIIVGKGDSRKEEAGLGVVGGIVNNGSETRQGYSPMTWIQIFCQTPGNEFFTEVPVEFIRESLNLIDIGRGVNIPYYQSALSLLLGERSAPPIAMEGEKAAIIQSSAALLYGLVHARYVVTTQGLQAVRDKFNRAHFGRCPRVYCQGQPVLPVGETDRPMQSSVKVFCPRCGDLFYPSGYVRDRDGAYWGTTLAHLLLLDQPKLEPSPNPHQYIPRVFGFRVQKEGSGTGSGLVEEKYPLQ